MADQYVTQLQFSQYKDALQRQLDNTLAKVGHRHSLYTSEDSASAPAPKLVDMNGKEIVVR